MLARWQMSYPEGGQLYMLSGLICTSRSLEPGQQASLLVTWAEVALLWGAFVPVLLPSVLLATGANMLMCKVGHGHFGVEHLARDKAATGMSRRYLHGSLCVLVCFQNWFAWSSGMHGRWLLLLTALIYVLELGGFLSFGFVQTRNMVAIVDDRCPHSNGDNDLEMIRRKKGAGPSVPGVVQRRMALIFIITTHLNLHAFGPGCPWHCDVMPSFF